MLTALPLVLLLSQAEPAPPAAEAAPAAAEPGPASKASPAPVVGPTAPESEIEGAPERLATAVGLAAGGSYRLGAAAHDTPPAFGFTLTTFVSHCYSVIGDHLALGVAGSFAYERYSRTVRAESTVAPGQVVPYDGVRELTSGTFVGLQTVTLLLGRARPWVALGGGLGLDHFKSPELPYAPRGEARATVALLQGALGFDLQVAPQTDAGLRLDYVRPLSDSTFVTTAGERLHLFGSRLSVRMGIQYRF